MSASPSPAGPGTGGQGWREAPPLRGCGLDRPPPVRPLSREAVMVESERGRSFLDQGRAIAILPPASADRLSLQPEARVRGKRAIELFGAEAPSITLPTWPTPSIQPFVSETFPTISTTTPAHRTPVSAARSRPTRRPGRSPMTGRRAFRSRQPRWSCLKPGSATCSMKCSGPADDLTGGVRRALPSAPPATSASPPAARPRVTSRSPTSAARPPPIAPDAVGRSRPSMSSLAPRPPTSDVPNSSA